MRSQAAHSRWLARDNLVLLLFLHSKNNNEHARAKPLIVTLRVTMVSQRETIKRFAVKIKDFKCMHGVFVFGDYGKKVLFFKN